MTSKTLQQEERDEAIRELRRMIPKGSNVYVNVVHRSRANASWKVTVSVIASGELVRITKRVAKAIEWPIRKGEMVGGGNVDPPSTVAYSLGKVLYEDGYAIKGEPV